MTHRHAHHTAEVLRMAIHGGSEPQFRGGRSPIGRVAIAAGVLAGVAAGYLLGRALVR